MIRVKSSLKLFKRQMGRINNIVKANITGNKPQTLNSFSEVVLFELIGIKISFLIMLLIFLSIFLNYP